MAKKTEIIGLKKLLKDLDKLNIDVFDEVRNVTGATAQGVEGLAKNNARSSINYGKLAQGIKAIEATNIKSKRLEFKVMANATGLAPYSAYIEFGTGGKVDVPAAMKDVANEFRGSRGGSFHEMIDNLTDWVGKKGLTGSYSIKTKRRSRAKNSRGESNKQEDRRIAFAIAMSILKNGIRPQPFLYPAFKAGTKNYIRDLRKGLTKLMKKV